MKKKKVFIFLPDEGGLRNFAFSAFKDIGDKKGFHIFYWNNSIYPIKEKLGYNEVKIKDTSVHPLTPLYCRARKRVELNVSKKKFEDSVYDTYKFPLNFKGYKNTLKSLFISFLIGFYGSEKGLKKLRKKIETLERRNPKYQLCKIQLQAHRPDLVFCSNQRNTQAISGLLAARDLGIKTACFVQSWDNVPKAMQILEPDYYFVWSDLMKQELLKYYPYIKEKQVFVTGTPQFEMHFNTDLAKSRNVFFEQHNLDIKTKYICFSGDDETTSPLDQYYLEDLANAIRSLNTKGFNLGIIYRKCPFDLTDRYDKIINKNQDIITVINPIWERIDGASMGILPQKEDLEMLYNVCEHSEFVTNVCSSTVFDFVAHNKPCVYYNYEQPQLKKGIRDIGQNYDYVHFRSMPSKDAVIFCYDKQSLEGLLKQILDGELSNVEAGSKWFKTVAGSTPTESSMNIWDAITKIT
jgi:hypothetical protein